MVNATVVEHLKENFLVRSIVLSNTEMHALNDIAG